MNGRCDVCGCKTEHEQLKEYAISGEKREVCVFCKKQLDLMARDPVGNSESALNMLSQDTKGNRTQKTQTLLEKHFSALGVGAVGGQKAELSGQKAELSGGSQSAQVEELKKQVEALSNELKSFKKSYFISKILSIALPIVLVVVMLIVLIASGALKNIFGYYDYLSELANM